jgi:hypothetical protein
MKNIDMSKLKRESAKEAEIISFLARSAAEQIKFVIWPEHNSTSQFTFSGSLANVDDEDGTIMLNTLVPPKKKLSDVECNYYFLSQDKDLLFKAKLNDKFFTNFQLPKKIRAPENRKYTRTEYKKEHKREIDVSFVSKTGERLKVLTTLLNVSKGGMCLMVSRETLSQISFDREVLVHSMELHPEYKDFQGYIRNARTICKISLKQDNFYALGIEWNI